MRNLKFFLVVLLSGFFVSSFSYSLVESATFNVRGKTIVARASSGIQGVRGGGGASTLPLLFDNDSTTAWFEGRADERTGRWIDVRYPGKTKMRGLVLGLGCRKEPLCMEDFSLPVKMSLKLDEKPPSEYGVDWDIKAGVLSRESVNMRKVVVWFNSDTAYTSAVVQLKFLECFNGSRYSNIAVSDFEIIEPNDSRFELLSLLTSKSFNPNDLGTINSPVLFTGSDEPQWITSQIDSLYKAGVSLGDLGQVEAGLNATSHAITNSEEIVRLIGVLKKQLITNNRLPRFLVDGRSMTYMMFVGSLSLGSNKYLSVWRYITTKKTSRGLELTVRYVPFVN